MDRTIEITSIRITGEPLTDEQFQRLMQKLDEVASAFCDDLAGEGDAHLELGW
jgi:hypothetical protein